MEENDKIKMEGNINKIKMEQNIKIRRRRRGTLDSLQYLKMALINCRQNRMRLQKQKETSGPKKIKATSQSGFTFYYSVTDSDLDSPAQQEVEEDASDEDSDDSDEDEIVDYVAAAEPIAQHYSSFSETSDHQEYFDYLDLDSYSYQNQLESAVSKSIYDETSTSASPLPTSFEEFVKNLENAENSNTNQTGEKSTFISYEHFFSALKESSQLNNVIKKFDELKTSDSTEKLSEDKSIHVTCSGDSLISGAESLQKSSVRFTENYTLAYLDSAIESDFTQLKNSEESLLNFSNTELENNNNAANSEESQPITDYSIENQSENHSTNSEVAVSDQQYSNETSESEQDFSCKYLDYLDSISEENQLDSEKSNEINQESDNLLIDSELLFKNEFSIDSAYSSEYCFTPEEIEEFTNEFETLTNLT